MPGMSGMASCKGAGCWTGAGAVAEFFGLGFLGGGDFLAGIAIPGIVSIFMPGMLGSMPCGEADCAAGTLDNKIASVMTEALAACIA
jgi:hypothetical protein